MVKKTIISDSAEDAMPFEAIIEQLHKSNGSMLDISQDDKVGGKLSKKIAPLVDTAIEYAPKFEQHLPRKFEIQKVANAQAAIKRNKLKIAALKLEVQRLEDNNVYLGIQTAKDYRTIYEASVEAVKEDASLKSMSDELGAPYKKPTLSDERKAEIAQTNADKAAAKAAVLVAKVAAKAAK